MQPAAGISRSGRTRSSCKDRSSGASISRFAVAVSRFEFAVGTGIPAMSRGYLTSLLTNTRLHFFGNHWRFFGQPKWCCDLGVRRPKAKAWKASTLCYGKKASDDELTTAARQEEKNTASQNQAGQSSPDEGPWDGHAGERKTRVEWSLASNVGADSLPVRC
jgi:hypothetical protein